MYRDEAKILLNKKQVTNITVSQWSKNLR